MKKFTFVILAVVLAACTDEAGTRKTLRNAGFTDVEITGYSWWACGDDDTFHTGFRAKNPRGETVEGTVCCGGLTKGCTVRF